MIGLGLITFGLAILHGLPLGFLERTRILDPFLLPISRSKGCSIVGHVKLAVPMHSCSRRRNYRAKGEGEGDDNQPPLLLLNHHGWSYLFVINGPSMDHVCQQYCCCPSICGPWSFFRNVDMESWCSIHDHRKVTAKCSAATAFSAAAKAGWHRTHRTRFDLIDEGAVSETHDIIGSFFGDSTYYQVCGRYYSTSWEY